MADVCFNKLRIDDQIFVAKLSPSKFVKWSNKTRIFYNWQCVETPKTKMLLSKTCELFSKTIFCQLVKLKYLNLLVCFLF